MQEVRKLFLGVTTKEATNGWPMANCGCENEDNGEDWSITTNGLKGDEVPDHCTDAKTFAKLAAGLLNAFYNEVDVSKMEAEQVIKMGTENVRLNIPHKDNPTLPF